MSAKLMFLCGKKAAGTSTLSRQLAEREDAVLLLARRLPVVLDFPGSTRAQRAWFRQLIDATGVPHELHYVDEPDAVCKRQLRERSAHLPPGTAWTSDAEFDAITAWFQTPAEDEGFTVIRYERGGQAGSAIHVTRAEEMIGVFVLALSFVAQTSVQLGTGPKMPTRRRSPSRAGSRSTSSTVRTTRPT